MTARIDHPVDGDGVTADYLNGLLLLSGQTPCIAEVEIEEARTYGDQMVSTAARVLFSVRYHEGQEEDWPTRLVLKIARTDDDVMAPFYENEVAFYSKLRRELDIEAPLSLGGDYDPVTRHFALLMENLTVRGAHFPNVLEAVTPDRVRSLLETLAKLHARYWNADASSPALGWMGNALEGGVATLLNDAAAPYIQYEIDTQKFKNELVGMLGWTGEELRAGTKAMHRHQLGLDQCVVHGDTHLGNTYFLPDGRSGLLDWQLMGRGHPMHDVSYIIATALSIADRRVHEQPLLEYYLDQLAASGARNTPSFEVSWAEYRRSMVWNVYVGWLTTPVVNYGWEINVMNHLRLVTAFEDLETGKLVRAVM
jgi:Ser/Thr protein kinase RdoA (MazF antagonist)